MKRLLVLRSEAPLRRVAAAVLACGGILVLLGAGCGGALSEEQQITALMAQSRQLEVDLREREQRIAELTGAGATPPAPAAPAPASEDPYRPIAIRFGKFTGLVGAGDPVEKQRLKIVIEPLDAEGDVVKRAGSLQVEALEEGAKEETPRPFHRWEFPQEELAQTWLSGLGAYAYVLKLPWPDGRRPSADRLLLRATFTTLAGEPLTTETRIDLGRPVLQP
jgi:hypothetical protein